MEGKQGVKRYGMYFQPWMREVWRRLPLRSASPQTGS